MLDDVVPRLLWRLKMCGHSLIDFSTLQVKKLGRGTLQRVSSICHDSQDFFAEVNAAQQQQQEQKQLEWSSYREAGLKPEPNVSSFFWWLNLARLYSLYKILYPNRRIYSYSILGTIVSPNKILLK